MRCTTNLISAFQKAIELLDTVCRKALKVVIDFAKKPIAKWFTYEQSCAVNEFLDMGSDRHGTVDTLITFSQPFLTENEHAKGRLEVQNVVNGFALYERIKQQNSDRLNLPKCGRKI